CPMRKSRYSECMDANSSAVAEPTLRLPLPPELTRRTDPFRPPAALVELNEKGPVNRVELTNGEPFWLISGHSEARAVLADPRFSADRARNEGFFKHLPKEYREQLRDEQNRAGSFIGMDPPEHTRYRRLLTGQFTVRRMRDLGPRIEQIVTDRLDAMLAGGNTADLVPAFGLPVPSLVICERLGVDYADRAEFQRRSAILLRMDTPISEVLAAGNELRAFMRSLIKDKRANPGDDLISGLAHGEGDLTDDELVNI